MLSHLCYLLSDAFWNIAMLGCPLYWTFMFQLVISASSPLAFIFYSLLLQGHSNFVCLWFQL